MTRSDAFKSHSPTLIHLSDLQNASPLIPWFNYLRTRLGSLPRQPQITIHKDTLIHLWGGLSFYQSLSSILESAELHVLEAFLLWRSIIGIGTYDTAHHQIRELLLPLFKYLQERKWAKGDREGIENFYMMNEHHRDDFCVETVNNYMNDIMGFFYVRQNYKCNQNQYFLKFSDVLKTSFTNLY